MRLQLTALAEADLLGIGRHIALDNPDRAVSFVGELEMACISLRDNPLLHPVIRRRRGYEIRRRVHGNYLILYTITARDIVVLRVVHGAMDYDRWLDEDYGMKPR